MRHIVLIAMISLWAHIFVPGQTALALSPEEQLDNPVLEDRARALSAQLRCLVCQNQSIDDSDADLAKDLRREVRSQLLAGKSDEAILNQLQLTYGDYVLLKPPVSWRTYALWLAPLCFIVLALWLFILSRRTASASRTLSIDEPVQESKDTEQVAENIASIGSTSLSKAMMGTIFVLIFGSTALIYVMLGDPTIESKPLASRTDERQQEQQQNQIKQAGLAEALSVAQEEAKANPQSVQAHLTLALAYARLDDFDNEIASLRTAQILSNDSPSIKAMVAEALSRQAGGQIILPARALIEEVLDESPNEPRALFMAGLASYQDEFYQQAIAYWMKLADVAPASSPWPALARQNITFAAEAGGLPLPEGVAPNIDVESAEAISNASEAEQQEMIKAMVSGLETRLQEAPDDEEGWQRLVQARRVLGEETELVRALNGYAKAFPQKRDAQLYLLEVIFELGLSERYMSDAQMAVSHLAMIDEQAPEYLFFAGHVAVLQGDKIIAKKHWEELLSALPKQSALYDQIAAQIESLK